METEKILAGDSMKEISVKKEGMVLKIGKNPELIVNLADQKNFIKVDDTLIPYKKEVLLSKDLLAGKRKNVFDTAIKYYYRQACAVAEGIAAAKEYRLHCNTTIREF